MIPARGDAARRGDVKDAETLLAGSSRVAAARQLAQDARRTDIVRVLRRNAAGPSGEETR